MEQLELIKLLLESSVAAVALIALIAFIFQQRNKDNKESGERMGYIGVMKVLATNIETSTKAMEALEASLKIVGADAQSAAAILRDAKDNMQAVSVHRDEQLRRLQESVDNMPSAVREQLVDDFVTIGDSLQALSGQTLQSHNSVQKALKEWGIIGSRLQRVLSRVEPEEAAPESCEETTDNAKQKEE